MTTHSSESALGHKSGGAWARHETGYMGGKGNVHKSEIPAAVLALNLLTSWRMSDSN